jgi:cysteine-rich repeat protein
MLPGRCGDGNVDAAFGEECDNGEMNSDTTYDGCTTMCKLGPRCGDGIVQAPEVCDDGNRLNGDGCNVQCLVERPALK